MMGDEDKRVKSYVEKSIRIMDKSVCVKFLPAEAKVR